ncbi:MAG: hypothetical protein KY460_10405, partial [Actinobacteria bacterium]|nr:hypothetical protein [Actinomycetota bacterium]
ATLDAVKGQRELAKGQFRVRIRWINGTHNRSTFSDFYVAGGEQEHIRRYTADADHPVVLVGDDKGPSGAESCFTRWPRLSLSCGPARSLHVAGVDSRGHRPHPNDVR